MDDCGICGGNNATMDECGVCDGNNDCLPNDDQIKLWMILMISAISLVFVIFMIRLSFCGKRTDKAPLIGENVSLLKSTDGLESQIEKLESHTPLIF